MVGPHRSVALRVSGAKHSIKLSTFYTSTGILSLDEVLNGGVCAGTMSLFENDFHETYTKQIFDLFVAEGLVSGHSFLYASKEKVEQLLARLPDVIESVPEGPVETDSLRIAWRYNKLEDIDRTTISTPYLGHHFDLSSTMNSAERIQERDLEVATFSPDSSESLTKNLSNFILSLQKFLTSKCSSNIQRIVLTAAFTPLWGYCEGTLEWERTVLWFLTTLRLLIQGTLCIVYLSAPVLPAGLRSRIHHYADYAYTITGFDGPTGKNTAYSDFDGLFTVTKLPWLGDGLEPISRPLTMDWAFKVKRRQFLLQKLHLPPCLSDNVSRSNVSESVLSSASKSNKIVDF